MRQHSLAAAFIVIVVGLTSASQAEVLFYEDFETDLSRWDLPTINLAGLPAGSMHRTQDEAHGGNSSATFEIRTLFGDAFSDFIAVTPGQTYYLHLARWATNSEGFVGLNLFATTDEASMVQEHWMMGGGPTDDFVPVPPLIDGVFTEFFSSGSAGNISWEYQQGDWRIYSAEYTIPAGVHFVSVKMEHDGEPGESVAEGSRIYFDDVELSTNPTPAFLATTVAVDLRPGSDNVKLNLKSKGVIPVAILSSASFDATTVDGATVRVAGAAPDHGDGHLEDVDGDGDTDWLGHFRVQDLDADTAAIALDVTGQTVSGQALVGAASVNMSSPGRSKPTTGAISWGMVKTQVPR